MESLILWFIKLFSGSKVENNYPEQNSVQRSAVRSNLKVSYHTTGEPESFDVIIGKNNKVEVVETPIALNRKVSSNKYSSEIQRAHRIWTTQINGVGVDPNSYWAKLREKVFLRDHNCCTSCGSITNLTVHHRTPLSLGGKNTLNNLVLLCADCHEETHKRHIFDKTFEGDGQYGKSYRIPKKIATLSSAIENGQRVAIRYTDYNGIRSLRVIKPKKIFKELNNKVYVHAFCELDKDHRIFRASRIVLIKPGKNIINRYIDKPLVNVNGPDESVIRALQKHIR